MARHEDRSLLEAALAGFQLQLQRITAAIGDIQKRLRYAGAGGVPAPMLRTSSPPKGSRISPEGLERIRQGQMRRWAAAAKAKAAAKASSMARKETGAAHASPKNVAVEEGAASKSAPFTTAHSRPL